MALTNHIVSDSPTNNFAALNPLDAGTNLSFTNGNLRISSSSNPNNNTKGTIGVNAGKWYFEYVIVSGNNSSLVGIGGQSASLSSNFSGDLYAYDSPGAKNVNGSSSSYGTSFVVGDIIGVFFDLDLLKIEFFKSNVSQGVITGITSGITWSPFVHVNTATGHINFGQDPTFAGNKSPSTTYTDANGIGAFYYQPPTDALALCTANLPDFTPTVTGDVPQDYFKAVIWTGNGTGTSRTIDIGIEADLVWSKRRSADASHPLLYDSVRGTAKDLKTSLTSSENLNHTNGYISSSLSSNSITYTDGDSTNYPRHNYNDNGINYVVWCWKAGGAPSGSTSTTGSAKRINTSGTQDDTSCSALATAASNAGASNVITPTLMSINQAAGFSIVKYNGNGTSDDVNYSIPHGLSYAPDVVIVKNLDLGSQTSGISWPVLFTNIGAFEGLDGSGDINNPDLNSNWSGSYPNANTFFVRRPSSSSTTNRYRTMGDYNYIAYCWHSVEGYSKFGSYTGNGSTDGPFVYTGFRPAFLMVKKTNGTDNWEILDAQRPTYNPTSLGLAPNLSDAEITNRGGDFLSNGFKLRFGNGTSNESGYTYIYMAFAEQPFKFSNAR